MNYIFIKQPFLTLTNYFFCLLDSVLSFLLILKKEVIDSIFTFVILNKEIFNFLVFFIILSFIIIYYSISNTSIIPRSSSSLFDSNNFPQINPPEENYLNRIKETISDYKEYVFSFVFVLGAGIGIYYYFKYNQSQINLKQLQEEYETKFILLNEEVVQLKKLQKESETRYTLLNKELHYLLVNPSENRRHYKYDVLKKFYSTYPSHFDFSKILAQFFKSKNIKSVNFELVFSTIRRNCLHLPFVNFEDYQKNRINIHRIFIDESFNLFLREYGDKVVIKNGNFVDLSKNLNFFIKQDLTTFDLETFDDDSDRVKFDNKKYNRKDYLKNYLKFFFDFVIGNLGNIRNSSYNAKFDVFSELYFQTFYDFDARNNIVITDDSFLAAEKKLFLDPFNEIRFDFFVNKKFDLMSTLNYDVFEDLRPEDKVRIKQIFLKKCVLNFFLNDVLILNDRNSINIDEIIRCCNQIDDLSIEMFDNREYVQHLLISLRSTFYNDNYLLNSEFDINSFTNEELEIFLDKLYKK